MVTTCDPINPYTEMGVYNGGFKPDKSLKWLPPDSNVIGDDFDDFIPPPTMPPQNILMQTCEGRRIDPRVGGVPERKMEFDSFKEVPQIAQVEPPPVKNVSLYSSSPTQNDMNNLLLLLIVLGFVFLFMTRFSSSS